MRHFCHTCHRLERHDCAEHVAPAYVGQVTNDRLDWHAHPDAQLSLGACDACKQRRLCVFCVHPRKFGDGPGEIPRLKPWRFPGPMTHGMYENDGPDVTAEFELDGCKFRVTPTGDTGIDSGRKRYRSECLTHAVVMHENTTGGWGRCQEHLDALAREARRTAEDAARAEADAQRRAKMAELRTATWQSSGPGHQQPQPVREEVLRLCTEISRLRCSGVDLTTYEEQLLCDEFASLAVRQRNSRETGRGNFMWTLIFEVR